MTVITILKNPSHITPHRCQYTSGRLQCQPLASAHHSRFRMEQASARLRLVWEHHTVVSVRQIGYSAMVLCLPLWLVLVSLLRLRILGSERKLQESAHHHMESGNRRAIFLVWARHTLVQELVRLLLPLPRPEFESQKELRSHRLVCGSQLQMHQSHLHRDLGRRVYGHRIATQASSHQLQYYK